MGSSLPGNGAMGGIPRGPQDLTIGLLAEITGPLLAVGRSCRNAAQLAVEEINLRRIRSFQGVTGDMFFEPGSGDPIKGAVILQIKNGKFVWFADVTP
jgi:ABC-type branched-subunit amino acid transport system substrate-binding protein